VLVAIENKFSFRLKEFLIKNDSFKYYKLPYTIMTTQINIRVSEDFLDDARNYAKIHGYLNIQEFIRDAAREKIYEQYEVRNEYLEKLNSKDATTFLSDDEADEFDKELEKRVKLEWEKESIVIFSKKHLEN